jgi:hypothetical protein
LLTEFRKRLPEMVTRAPDMPRLLHSWLTQQVEGSHQLKMQSQDLRDLTQMIRGAQRRIISAILGTGLLIARRCCMAWKQAGRVSSACRHRCGSPAWVARGPCWPHGPAQVKSMRSSFPRKRESRSKRRGCGKVRAEVAMFSGASGFPLSRE